MNQNSDLRRILVLGGSGFLGTHVCSKLSAQLNKDIVVPTRNRTRSKTNIIILPRTQLIQADISSQQELENLIKQSDAVINLASSRLDLKVNSELVGKIVEACSKFNVRRLIHLSLLNSEKLDYDYAKSKLEGERIVKDSNLDWTIIKSSVIFGPLDNYSSVIERGLNSFLSSSFGIFVIAPDLVEAPIWVQDVADVVVHSLDYKECFGSVLDVFGPDRISRKELAFEILGEHKSKICGLSYIKSLNKFVGGNYTWEELSAMYQNSDFLPSSQTCLTGLNFDLTFSTFSSVSPSYLKSARNQKLLDGWRFSAHR